VISSERRGVLKKTITYTDFNGDEVSEDFFFHLSKAELIELEMSYEGGMSDWFQKIIAAEDGKTIMEFVKKIILTSYGQKSADGRRFVKTQELRDEFASTEAYSVFFVELVTDAEKTAEFANGVLPQGLVEEAMKLTTADLQLVVPDPVPEPRVLTKTELEEMSREDLLELSSQIATGEVKLPEPE
jgi:hypothetical protein